MDNRTNQYVSQVSSGFEKYKVLKKRGGKSVRSYSYSSILALFWTVTKSKQYGIYKYSQRHLSTYCCCRGEIQRRVNNRICLESLQTMENDCLDKYLRFASFPQIRAFNKYMFHSKERGRNGTLVNTWNKGNHQVSVGKEAVTSPQWVGHNLFPSALGFFAVGQFAVKKKPNRT